MVAWVDGKKVKNDILNLTDIFSSFCRPEYSSSPVAEGPYYDTDGTRRAL